MERSGVEDKKTLETRRSHRYEARATPSPKTMHATIHRQRSGFPRCSREIYISNPCHIAPRLNRVCTMARYQYARRRAARRVQHGEPPLLATELPIEAPGININASPHCARCVLQAKVKSQASPVTLPLKSKIASPSPLDLSLLRKSIQRCSKRRTDRKCRMIEPRTLGISSELGTASLEFSASILRM